MKNRLADYKNPLVYAFWSTVNHVVVTRHFNSIEINDRTLIPLKGGFVLVSNHITRWDGLLWYHLIGRPANFMVSPNELLGVQGFVLKSMGAFPASAKYDLQSHVNHQLKKGEGIVVFPEGDIYRDGSTHRFKSGAARLALNAAAAGIHVPLLPAAITYDAGGKKARVLIGEPVDVTDYITEGLTNPVRALSERLHREVCHLRAELGCAKDACALYSKHGLALTG